MGSNALANPASTNRKITLKIAGMHCAACSSKVERALGKIDGVAEAVVNLATEKATVSYDPGKTGPVQFKERIEKLGYQVVVDRVELKIDGMT